MVSPDPGPGPGPPPEGQLVDQNRNFCSKMWSGGQKKVARHNTRKIQELVLSQKSMVKFSTRIGDPFWRPKKGGSSEAE